MFTRKRPTKQRSRQASKQGIVEYRNDNHLIKLVEKCINAGISMNSDEVHQCQQEIKTLVNHSKQRAVFFEALFIQFDLYATLKDKKINSIEAPNDKLKHYNEMLNVSVLVALDIFSKFHPNNERTLRCIKMLVETLVNTMNLCSMENANLHKEAISFNCLKTYLNLNIKCYAALLQCVENELKLKDNKEPIYLLNFSYIIHIFSLFSQYDVFKDRAHTFKQNVLHTLCINKALWMNLENIDEEYFDEIFKKSQWEYLKSHQSFVSTTLPPPAPLGNSSLMQIITSNQESLSLKSGKLPFSKATLSAFEIILNEHKLIQLRTPNLFPQLDDILNCLSKNKLRIQDSEKMFLNTIICGREILAFPNDFEKRDFIIIRAVLSSWIKRLDNNDEQSQRIVINVRELAQQIHGIDTNQKLSQSSKHASNKMGPPSWFFVYKNDPILSPTKNKMMPDNAKAKEIRKTIAIGKFLESSLDFEYFLSPNNRAMSIFTRLRCSFTQENYELFFKIFQRHTKEQYEKAQNAHVLKEKACSLASLYGLTRYIVSNLVSYNQEFVKPFYYYTIFLLKLQAETFEAARELKQTYNCDIIANQFDNFMTIHAKLSKHLLDCIGQSGQLRESLTPGLCFQGMKWDIQACFTLMTLTTNRAKLNNLFTLVEEKLKDFLLLRTKVITKSIGFAEFQTSFLELSQTYFERCQQFNREPNLFYYPFSSSLHLNEEILTPLLDHLRTFEYENGSWSWEKEAADALRKKSKLEQELLIASAQQDKSLSKIESFKKHLQQMQRAQIKSKTKISALSKQTSDLNDRLSTLEKNLKNERKALTDERHKRKQSEKKLSEANEKLTAIKMDRNRVERQVIRLTSDMQFSEQQRIEGKRTLDALANKHHDLQDAYGSMEESMRSLTLENQELKDNQEALTFEIQNLRKILETYEQKKANEQSKYESFCKAHHRPTIRQVSSDRKHKDKASIIAILDYQEQFPKGTLEVPTIAKDMMVRIQAQGEQAYLVGGFVRDSLLGLSGSRDIDIVTSCPPDLFKKLFPNFKQNKHMPYLFKSGDMDICCHPNLNLIEDANQRDLTINALYVTHDGKLLDPLNRGLNDLSNKQLNMIKDFTVSMVEDPSRLIRYLKLWLETNWEIPIPTIYQLQELLADLNRVPFGIYLINIARLFEKHPDEKILKLMHYGLLGPLFHVNHLDAHLSTTPQILQRFNHRESTQGLYAFLSNILCIIYQIKLKKLQITLDPNEYWAHRVVFDFLKNWPDNAFIKEYPREKVHQILIESMMNSYIPMQNYSLTFNYRRQTQVNTPDSLPHNGVTNRFENAPSF